MNKNLLNLIFILILIPFFVHAESCNPEQISIQSISIEEEAVKGAVLETPTFNSKNINLNLTMSKVGDSAKYKIILENNSSEDFNLNENSFKSNSKYIDYNIKLDDDSYTIKGNSSKTIYLMVEYKNKIPNKEFESEIYNDNKKITVQLSNEPVLNIIETLKNPNTKTQSYMILLLIILGISSTLYIYFKKKIQTKYLILLGMVSVLVPIYVYAACKSEIIIDSNVIINKKPPKTPVSKTIYWALQDNDNDNKNETLIISSNDVTGNKFGSFAGDKVFEDETKIPWIDGWYEDDTGLPDDILCYYVDNVKVEGLVAPVSTSHWFDHTGSGVSSFTADLTNLDVSNVTDMSGMFDNTGSSAIEWHISDLSDWDTSNVTDMSGMFWQAGNNARTWEVVGISNWDTSSVRSIYYMFGNAAYQTTTINLDLSNWDTSNITEMFGTFSSFGNNSETFSLNLSGWDTSKVTNMKFMFERTGMYATSWNINGLSNWDTSKVTDMRSMFERTGYKANEYNLDLSNWNTSNVEDMRAIFYDAGLYSKNFYLNIANWDTSNVEDISAMFAETGMYTTNWNITIPKSNNKGINNTNDTIYGTDISTYYKLNQQSHYFSLNN